MADSTTTTALEPTTSHVRRAFLSLSDTFGAEDTLQSIRLAAAGLSLRDAARVEDADDIVAWKSQVVPLPVHARQAAHRGVGALYAALRGLRAARLGFALRRWAVSAATLDAADASRLQLALPQQSAAGQPRSFLGRLDDAHGLHAELELAHRARAHHGDDGGDDVGEAASPATAAAAPAALNVVHLESLGSQRMAGGGKHPVLDSPRPGQRPFIPFGPSAPFTPNTG